MFYVAVQMTNGRSVFLPEQQREDYTVSAVATYVKQQLKIGDDKKLYLGFTVHDLRRPYVFVLRNSTKLSDVFEEYKRKNPRGYEGVETSDNSTILILVGRIKGDPVPVAASPA